MPCATLSSKNKNILGAIGALRALPRLRTRPACSLKKMVRNEGWISFYRGVTAPLLGNMVLLGEDQGRQQAPAWGQLPTAGQPSPDQHTWPLLEA